MLCYLEEIPKEVSNVIHFKHLKNLTVSDSPKCPLQPILMICQQSPELNRLAISGCSYTEEDMCQLVSLCPKLTAIKLGSHASAAMSMTGGAGGDVFAQTLAEKCPLITLADLTGIISMTDMGFNYLMEALSNTLEKLYIRRAMQISVDSLLNVTILKNLRRLTFANVPHLTDQLVVNVMEHIGSQLHFLQLENIPIEDESFIAVSTYCTNLTQLRIFECDDWLDIRNILVESNMKKLKVLIIHDCKSLEGEVECSHSLISESESPELDSFPENPRIRDTSYMSPTLESLPCTPTSATALSPFPSSSPRNHCEISFQLSHLEFIGCDSVSLDTVFNLLNHCRTLKRFIFAGQALNGKIRKHLLDRRPRLKASLYVLTPSTPGFE
ncbi:hypothetical protein HDV02_000633 [Globomyces sp. JEL0801]|nr:hypothetical protein HDV02_000633 [Globomyces sp. JEL0801]